jgi:hypothetical protein
MRLRPQYRGSSQGINTGSLPPLGFIAATMELAVVATAEWDREFVAHLASERPVLSKAQVVSVRRAASTEEAGLLGDELNVALIPHPARLWEGEAALIDAGSLGPGLCKACRPA